MFCGGGFGFHGFGPSGFNNFGSFGFMNSSWMFAFMGIRFIIFIIFILLGVKLFRRYTRSSNYNASLKILDERFAKGEISEEEFIRRRTILSQKN